MTPSSATRKDYIPTFKLFQGAEEWPIKEIVHHEYIQNRCDESKGEIFTHRHLDLFHLVFLKQGTAKAILDGQEFVVSGPALATIPAMSVHGIMPETNIYGHLLTLPGPSLEYILRDTEDYIRLNEKPYVFTDIRTSNFVVIEALLSDLGSEYQARKRARSMAIQALLRLIFVWIVRQLNDHSDNRQVIPDRGVERIRKFKRLIESSFNQGKSIKEYARDLGVSATQLNNICRAKVGKSALEIVHDRIVLEAKRHLLYTSKNISEISYLLGFSDPAYFTRFFTKNAGVPPKRFRASVKTHSIYEVDMPVE